MRFLLHSIGGGSEGLVQPACCTHAHARTHARAQHESDAPVRPSTPQAMFVDFGMAARYGGVCYLRYDDTNPNAEKQVRRRGGGAPPLACLPAGGCGGGGGAA